MPAAPRTFHLVAVGGTAMTPLAALLLARGERVTGSDGPLYPPMEGRLESLGIRVLPAFSADNVGADVTEVVAGNLARRDNPEILEALRRGVRVRSMPETLHDEILAGRHPVVVAGTHGKTTTTALIAWILAAAGRDPGYLVGGEPANFPGPAALGGGAPFVVEGDEYSTSYADKGPKFLHYAPRTFVLTSVEFDHADLYADLAAVKAAFRKGLAIVPEDGLVVACADDANVRDVLPAARARVVTYSIDGVDADFRASNVRETEEGIFFECEERRGAHALEGSRSRSLPSSPSLFLPLSGRHNVANALAAFGVARAFSLTFKEISSGLSSFRGVRRRMEIKGTARGVTVVDDFAHHPTAVATTIAGAKHRFAGRRVWAAFEPRSMTAGRADFLEPYFRALAQADAVALAAPYHAQRLSQPGGPGALDAEALVARLTAAGKPALTAPAPDALLAALIPELRAGDVVVAMSSGAFGGFPGQLLESLRRL